MVPTVPSKIIETALTALLFTENRSKHKYETKVENSSFDFISGQSTCCLSPPTFQLSRRTAFTLCPVGPKPAPWVRGSGDGGRVLWQSFWFIVPFPLYKSPIHQNSPRPPHSSSMLDSFTVHRLSSLCSTEHQVVHRASVRLNILQQVQFEVGLCSDRPVTVQAQISLQLEESQYSTSINVSGETYRGLIILDNISRSLLEVEEDRGQYSRRRTGSEGVIIIIIDKNNSNKVMNK